VFFMLWCDLRTPYRLIHVCLSVMCFSNSVNWSHCWGTLLQQCEPRSLLLTVTSDHILQWWPLIPLLHLLFLWLLCWWHSLWCGMKNTFGICVLQRVHLSNLVSCLMMLVLVISVIFSGIRPSPSYKICAL
jgi:hypothetical protein